MGSHAFTHKFVQEFWYRQAACGDVDPAVFFSASPGDVAFAKKTCRGCPVRAECLNHAVRLPEEYGIWGGLTRREIRAIRRRLSIKPSKGRSRREV